MRHRKTLQRTPEQEHLRAMYIGWGLLCAILAVALVALGCMIWAGVTS